MKYKEFRVWCNERAADGCWDMMTAMFCVWVLREVKKIPFWKREKVWKENTKKR